MSNTVEVKEVPKKKTTVRLFSKREQVAVKPNKEFYDQYEAEEIEASIEPMTHDEAETRERLVSAIDLARLGEYARIGITKAQITQFAAEQNMIELSAKTEGEIQKMDKEELEEYSKYRTKEIDAFNKRWDELGKKLATKFNPEPIEDAESKLREFSIRMILKRCRSIRVAEESHPMSAGVLEACHPAIIRWLITEVEKISYLDQGERLGL